MKPTLITVLCALFALEAMAARLGTGTGAAPASASGSVAAASGAVAAGTGSSSSSDLNPNLSFNVCMELPAKLDFAGEAVPLDNRDTRESLIRELLTTSYMHSRTVLTLLNSQRYFAIIKPILSEQGVPEDFVFLCMAESGLNPEAVSGAGAGGLWQLMPTVARSCGLIVDNDIDERFNIEKATAAACTCLKSARDTFGSWTCAAASYNLGVTGVMTRIAKQGTDSYYDTFFPEETLRYVFRILSFKLLFDDPGRYGFPIPPEQYYRPLDGYRIEEVTGEQIDWSAEARSRGTTFKALRELNPWIRSYQYTNTQGYTFKVKFPTAGRQ